MDVFYAVIKILAGCGAFLLGFKLLSDNMEKIAGNRLKALFNKTSEKKLVGVGMGAVTTAVVQSSSITTVMVVGFVNAGIMTLNQATAVIMGANIGTTITAQIVALQSFDVETLFMSLIFIGVFMEMFSKSDKIKSCGLAFAGLGLVFMGLSVMSDTMKVYTDANPSIHAMLEKVTNPFLLLGIGIGLTALVQSSSAVTTIVITMAAQGLIYWRRRKFGALYYSRFEYRHLRDGAYLLGGGERQCAASESHSLDVQRIRCRYFYDFIALLADLPAEYV